MVYYYYLNATFLGFFLSLPVFLLILFAFSWHVSWSLLVAVSHSVFSSFSWYWCSWGMLARYQLNVPQSGFLWCFSLWCLDWLMGFGKEHHRGYILFSSQHIRGTHAHRSHDITEDIIRLLIFKYSGGIFMMVFKFTD